MVYIVLQVDPRPVLDARVQGIFSSRRAAELFIEIQRGLHPDVTLQLDRAALRN